MTIKEQLEKDFLTFYKAHDEAKTSILRLLKNAIKNAEIAKKDTLSDDEIIKVLQKEMKQRLEAITEYEKASRSELADKEKFESEVIKSYLPAQMGQEELTKIIEDTLEELSVHEMKDMGKAIGAVMAKVGSKTDGSTVSRLIKEIITAG